MASLRAAGASSPAATDARKTTVLSRIAATSLIAGILAAGAGGALADGYELASVTSGPLAYGWSGLYVGISGGGVVSFQGSNIQYFAPASGFAAATPGFVPEGGFAGGHIGYNWPRDHLVLGIEADVQATDMSDKYFGTYPSNSGPVGIEARQFVDYFGTVRGRLGYDLGRTLIYATGGFAFGGVRDRLVLTNAGFGTDTLKKDTIMNGFVLGAGAEHNFARAWSAKLEYQYIDLGSEKLSGVPTGGPPINTNRLDTTFQTFRLGLSYHFNAHDH
jgi:outer membrane immunogenic protein